MPRHKRFFEENKLFQVWLPESMNRWLEDYLQQNCQGDCTSARFRVFLFELKSLSDRGITIVKPIIEYEKDRLKLLRDQFGTTDPNSICLRTPDAYAKQNEIGRRLFCKYCRDSKRPEFQACMDIRKDLTKQLEKDGMG